MLAAAMLGCHLLKRGLNVAASLLRNRSATAFVDRLRVTLYAKVDGTVRFERMGKDRKKVSVYEIAQ